MSYFEIYNPIRLSGSDKEATERFVATGRSAPSPNKVYYFGDLHEDTVKLRSRKIYARVRDAEEIFDVVTKGGDLEQTNESIRNDLLYAYTENPNQVRVENCIIY